MTSNLIQTLREATELVRAQIPRGELTRGSVERLLEAAEAVCAAGPPAPPVRKPAQPNAKRLETRQKWARIAKQNERSSRLDSPE